MMLTAAELLYNYIFLMCMYKQRQNMYILSQHHFSKGAREGITTFPHRCGCQRSVVQDWLSRLRSTAVLTDGRQRLAGYSLRTEH